jgi:tetratricopeptide (TPR) repeat protein
MLVGREKEQKFLENLISHAESRRGATVFISGEAGIGKTRLADECMDIARSRGFRVLKGWCMHGSSTPYLPVVEALRSGGMEHIMGSDAPPKLENLFLVANNGVLISKRERLATAVDSDIFTGMLTAVTQFVDDCINQSGRKPDGGVFRMGHGSFNISAVSGRVATIAAVYAGKENEFLIDDLESALADIEKEFGESIKKWTGVKDELAGTETRLKAVFDSEKYEGIDWAENDPKTKQTNMLDNITRGLERTAKAQPILFFIDDLQWGDSSTIALLHYISRNTRNSRVLIIGTYRPEDLQPENGKVHPLTVTMQLMNREELFARIELGSLKDSDVGALVNAMLGKVKTDRMFTEHIWKESQGNPLFVQELVGMLRDEGIIVQRDGQWALSKTLERLEIPSRIQDVIERRLSFLRKEERAVLEGAAAIGDMFSTAILASLALMKRMEMLRLLNDIEKSHRLIQSQHDGYRFNHVKIRDVLYNGMSENLKREYHNAIGDVLGETYGTEESASADIGYHYYMAGDSGKALPHLFRAIELAKKNYSNAEAAKYCRYGLELASGGKFITERVSLLESLSKVQDTDGDWDGAIDSLRQAQSVIDKIIAGDSPEDVKKEAFAASTRILRKTGDILIRKGKAEDALAELQKGADLLKDDNCPELGRILSSIGNAYENMGDYDKSTSFQNRAMEIFSLSDGTEDDRAKSINRIGAAYCYKGDNDKALSCFEESLKLMEEARNIFGMGQALNNIGLLLHYKSEHEKALKYNEESLKLFTKLGHQVGIATSLGNIGLHYDSVGDYDRALEVHEKGLQLQEKIGDIVGMAVSYGNIGLTYSIKRDFVKAEEFIGKNLAYALKGGNQHDIAVAYNNMSTVMSARGNNEKALEHQFKSIEIFEKLGSQQSLSIALGGIAHIYADMGRFEIAEKTARDSIELARKVGFAQGEGASQRVLGVALSALGRWEDAEKAFEASAAILGDIGMRLEAADTFLEYGRMLKKWGQSPGGKSKMEKAKEKLNKALRLFEEIKLEHRADETRKDLEGL